MVLWEMTLATAYFLGLKRTYKLALKIQRKLITPKHPKIRLFLQRRTRNIFDVALTVHRKVQERDIEVGRNLGNRILRWLDRLKPSAKIRGPPPDSHLKSTKVTKHSNNSSNQANFPKYTPRNGDQDSGRHLFTAARSIMRSMRPTGSNIQHRQYGTGGAELFTVNYGKFGLGGVVRNDIRQYILHH